MRCVVLRFAFLALSCIAVSGKDFPKQNKLAYDSDIPKNYEASGAAWNPKTNKIATVSDEGGISIVSLDGNDHQCYTFSAPVDLESIAFGPEASLDEFVYVGHEWPGQILEFSLVKNTVTRVFNAPVQGSAKRGMEALTFIPKAGSSTEGTFLCGDYTSVTAYSFDFATAADGTTLSVIVPRNELIPGKKDISGLTWDPARELLWALYDTGADLYALSAQGTAWSVVRHYNSVPGTNQEGVAIAGPRGEYIVIANDVDKHSDKHKQLDRYDWEPQGLRRGDVSTSDRSPPVIVRHVKYSSCNNVVLPQSVPLASQTGENLEASATSNNNSNIGYLVVPFVAACIIVAFGIYAVVVHRRRRNNVHQLELL